MIIWQASFPVKSRPVIGCEALSEVQWIAGLLRENNGPLNLRENNFKTTKFQKLSIILLSIR